MAHATPVLDGIVSDVTSVMQDTGVDSVGIDPATLKIIIEAIMALFGGCALSAKQAERAARNLGVGFVGRIRDLKLMNLIEEHAADKEQAGLLYTIFRGLGEDLTAAKFTALQTELKSH